MLRSIAIHLALVAVLCCGGARAAEPPSALTPIPGTRVALPLPPGFTPATGFPGLMSPDAGGSIVVAELPGPFEALREGFGKERLASRGIALGPSQEVEVSGFPGLLLHATQNVQGNAYRKWILVFGDDSATVSITANVPQILEKDLGPAVVSALLAARWDPTLTRDLAAGLGFQVTESEHLKISQRIANGLILEPAGGGREPDAPFLVVAPSVSVTEIKDLAVFAKARLTQTRSVREPEVLNERSLVMDGMPAHELVAQAIDGRNGASVIVYQALAYDGVTYFLLQGFSPQKGSDVYIPEFRSVAESLKRDAGP